MSCDCKCVCGGSKTNCGGGAGCACSCGDGCGCCFFIPTNRPDVCCDTPQVTPPVTPQVDCCPSESVGGCVPVHPDPLHHLSGGCCRPVGGDMTIRAPLYALTIQNASDSVLRDSEGRPVLDSNGNVQSNQVQTGVAGVCSG